MKKIYFVIGPTAVGKTKFAIELANFLKTEIISADSRQIFKEMKIGTARPTDDELSLVKHHFIANKSIFEYYNASMYELEVMDLIDDLFKRHENLVVVGGSGLYIDALLFGIDDLPTIEDEIRDKLQKKYEEEGIESLRFELKKVDPEWYKKVDLKNPNRILKALEVSYQTGKPYSSFLTGKKKERIFEPVLIALNMDREKLHNKINKRVDLMLDEGLIDEVKELHPYKTLVPLKTVGYRELFDYFEGVTDEQTAIELVKRNTRRYARRQITWFKRYENTNWIDVTNGYSIRQIIENI
ncbi:MAG: tRNA (adenosine(37)-N6)-dimethylallyltransferase MiaA [Bacteroidales bacterium]|nr:tRNA (adenosine(37)-N6)-dimethylallyltransferase MiaA [Bacteroidales bacterium]